MQNDDSAATEKVQELQAQGFLTMADLRQKKADAAQDPKGHLVEGLVLRRSINLLVGDSTVGKTPFLLLMALCIALGRRFLGRTVERGTVLYIDGESERDQFLQMAETITRFLGAPTVPDTFLCWSPNWDEQPSALPLRTQALNRAREAGADFTVIDPYRVFFPKGETDTGEAVQLINDLRAIAAETSGAFFLPHHIRKATRAMHKGVLYSARPNLETNPRDWLEDAAGMRALVNQTDLRLGMAVRNEHEPGDVVLCGFRRMVGQVGPLYLERVADEEGEPRGYKLLDGVGLLRDIYKPAFSKLPPLHEDFGFGDAQRALGGNSGSNTKRFLDHCISIGLVVRSGDSYMRV